MKQLLLICFALPFFTLACSTGLFAQDVFGKWKTIDDASGEAKSIVEIYQEDDKVYGKIVELINPKVAVPICHKCCCEDKDQPILGMMIIRGLEKDGDEFSGGKVLEPISGKIYKCYITLVEENKLKIRGYIGFSLFGRTQYWYRVK